jgi:hypothetical protein
MSDATTLYEVYDSSNTLLYVGISLSAISRLSQHKADKDWYYDIKKIEMTHYPTRHEAEKIERLTIRTKMPVYNITHNDGSKHNDIFKDDSRFDNWGSKLRAAKAAGITRPTLDSWISSNKIPDRYIRDITPVGAKKKKYEVNINGIIRIAREKKIGRPGRRTQNKLVSLDNLDKLEKVINLIAKIGSL